MYAIVGYVIACAIIWPITPAKPPLPSPYYRVSAKALIRREGKLLLLREHSHHWILPGGGSDHGEEILAGLRRELTEELVFAGEAQIDPRPVHVGFGCGEWNDMQFKPQFFCFICYDVTINGQISAGPHTKELRYFSPAELDDLILADDEVEVIQAVRA